MAEPIDELRATARVWAPDFYVSALLAPRAARRDLIALAAFLGDIERIVATVSDPALAEIRLQWWREAIAGAEKNELTGHPIADALGEAIGAHNLPFVAFDGLLDARALDLYADAMTQDGALAAYLDKADGAAFVLAAGCLGSRDASPLIAASGRAYGLARVVSKLPVFLARGRVPFPGLEATDPIKLRVAADDCRRRARESLAQARIAWRTASRTERSACLPLAVVEAYLKAAERPGHDPARMLADVEPLTRMWRLWAAHMTGRF